MEEGSGLHGGNRGIFQSFASPSTLPHFLLLLLNTGLLYGIMKVGIFGLEEKGSTLFLSMTIAYCFAALLAPSSLGNLLFRVDDGGRGVMNSSYWTRSLVTLLPIGVVVSLISAAILTQVNSEDLKWITYLLASLFVLMSIGQAFSLTYGGIVYARKASKIVRPGRFGRKYTFVRSALCVLLFSPLVWWFGYDAGDFQSQSITENVAWVSFLIMIALISVIADKNTKNARDSSILDGIVIDRMVMLMVLALSWHLLSAWRRNPLMVDEATGTMLIEEVALMAITILLAVWSMANRGFNRGWRIFQGQSAVFWGIGFGYAYGGSIACLTSLSEGSLLTTTAGGHLLTALVMLAIMPLAIGRIGGPSSEGIGPDGSASGGIAQNARAVESSSVEVRMSPMVEPISDPKNTSMEHPDIVELLD